MKNTTMKIKCWKLEDGNEVPMPSTATLDGFEWNGKFRITVTDDDGSLGLPFVFAADDTAILTVVTSEQKGTHTGNKKIKQTLRCVPRSLGNEITCSRIRSHNGNEHVWSEWEQASSSVGTTVEWDSASCIDSFVTAGVYNITGERLNASDGLPIENSAPGHTISARLTVLNSSIAGTGDSDDKCVTQILTLSNRTGGDGDVYIRTGHAHSTNMLAGGSGWEPWGKLQQNIEVGQVTSLDGYIDNGMYSGVYTDGSSFFQTFVMVVINNYAVSGKTGNVRSVSQFKYALNVDSTFSCKTRTGHGSTGISWGEWVDLGAATTTDIQDNSITAQKLSSDVRKKVENPLRPLYIAAGAEYNDTGADKTKTAPWGETVIHKAGHYYLNGLGDITEEQMVDIYNYRDVIFNVDCSRIAQNISTRTIFSAYIKSGTITQLLERRKLQGYSSFHSCINLEILWFTKSSKGLESTSLDLLPATNILDGTFTDCISLRIISGINCSGVTSFNNTFIGCSSLVEVRLYRISTNVSFESSANISQSSILYIIKNAVPSSAITITLHPDAYARLANDADIVAALEAQPLVNIVCA